MATGTKHEQALLEDLRRAVHGVHAPFACGGTLVPEQPVTLRFRDDKRIAVLRAGDRFEQERLLQPLIDRCAAAAFGKGRKTVYDRTVRDALQIKAEGGAFSVLHFDPAKAGILEQIRRELMPHDSGTLMAELYNLNVYATGGHFVPHKDTPRGGDMIGTLVVCLPAQFHRGAFIAKHQGVFQTYDWGSAIEEQAEPSRIHWAAFFGDVDHQIERVWGGLRVTLTYLLRRGPDAVESAIPTSEEGAVVTTVRQKLRALLDDRRFRAKGETLAFPCSHLYHQDARFQRKQKPLSRQAISSLKGRDHDVAAAALAEGLEVTLCPYMIETCADETWQLDHFPTARERAALDDRMGAISRTRWRSGRLRGMEMGSMRYGWIRHRISMGSRPCTPGLPKAASPCRIRTCPPSSTSTRVNTVLRAISETKAATSISIYTVRCTWRFQRSVRALVEWPLRRAGQGSSRVHDFDQKCFKHCSGVRVIHALNFCRSTTTLGGEAGRLVLSRR